MIDQARASSMTHMNLHLQILFPPNTDDGGVKTLAMIFANKNGI